MASPNDDIRTGLADLASLSYEELDQYVQLLKERRQQALRIVMEEHKVGEREYHPEAAVRAVTDPRVLEFDKLINPAVIERGTRPEHIAAQVEAMRLEREGA